MIKPQERDINTNRREYLVTHRDRTIDLEQLTRKRYTKTASVNFLRERQNPANVQNVF